MKRRRVIFRYFGRGLALFLLMCLVATEKANAMGKLCIFSAVQGVVLNNGKPVSGATVERKFNWVWNKETGVDQAVTNAGGEFSLPAVFRQSFLGSLLPHQPFIEQTLLIKHDGREYKAWMFDKMDYEENSESGAKPMSVLCRLESEPSRKGGYFGICELR
jgi:hypothetical protein